MDLSMRDLTEITGYSTTKINRLIKDGKFPAAYTKKQEPVKRKWMNVWKKEAVYDALIEVGIKPPREEIKRLNAAILW